MGSHTTRNPNLDRQSPSVASAASPNLTHGEAWRANLGRDVVSFPRDATWWTGPDPHDPTCPGRRADGTLGALPPPNLAACTRAEVRAYFDNGWALTELLFAALTGEEAFYRPPYHDLRHPMIFYYVHPAALYVNKLRVAGLLTAPVDAYNEQLFETGVDEMSWDDLSKNVMAWPSVGACRAYRRRVYELVRGLIDTHPDLADGHAPITPSSPLWALFLSCDHERIHIETSSVLMRELPLALVRRPDAFPRLHPSAREVAADAVPAWRDPVAGRNFPLNPLQPVAAGAVAIGKDLSFPSFGWDNEYGARETRVEDFAATRNLTTNGEFHAFVVAGGYREQRWWSDEGWRWRGFRNVKWPTFWVPCGPQGSHQYLLRALFETVAMPWDWPADVNAHEARAYCAWRTEVENRAVALRLPTEAEHHRLRVAANLLPSGRLADVAAAWSLFAAPDLNLSLRHGSESPVGAGDRPFTDVFGNVWQWCEDDFHPLAGFRIHPVYDDFSTPCFDGEHTMLLGGSFISAGDEAMAHARYHFRPHFFQHAGFRVVDPLREGNDGAVVTLRAAARSNAASSADLAARTFAAFAPLSALLPSGIAVTETHRETLVAVVRRHRGNAVIGIGRALDVGCGPGGLTCALAPHFAEVIGADLRAEVIVEARRALAAGETGLAPEFASRVTYRQTDAASLPPDWLGFDLVLASRLLSRLPSPKSFLGRAGGARGLVRPGGLLVIADTFAWDADVTPPQLWFDGDASALAALLGPEFRCVDHGTTFAVERPRPGRVEIEELRYTAWTRTEA